MKFHFLILLIVFFQLPLAKKFENIPNWNECYDSEAYTWLCNSDWPQCEKYCDIFLNSRGKLVDQEKEKLYLNYNRNTENQNREHEIPFQNAPKAERRLRREVGLIKFRREMQPGEMVGKPVENRKKEGIRNFGNFILSRPARAVSEDDEEAVEKDVKDVDDDSEDLETDNVKERPTIYADYRDKDYDEERPVGLSSPTIDNQDLNDKDSEKSADASDHGIDIDDLGIEGDDEDLENGTNDDDLEKSTDGRDTYDEDRKTDTDKLFLETVYDDNLIEKEGDDDLEIDLDVDDDEDDGDPDTDDEGTKTITIHSQSKIIPKGGGNGRILDSQQSGVNYIQKGEVISEVSKTLYPISAEGYPHKTSSSVHLFNPVPGFINGENMSDWRECLNLVSDKWLCGPRWPNCAHYCENNVPKTLRSASENVRKSALGIPHWTKCFDFYTSTWFCGPQWKESLPQCIHYCNPTEGNSNTAITTEVQKQSIDSRKARFDATDSVIAPISHIAPPRITTRISPKIRSSTDSRKAALNVPDSVIAPTAIGSTLVSEVSITNTTITTHRGWTSWSVWSPCSNRCGNGFQARQRQCRTSLSCKGGNREIELCAEIHYECHLLLPKLLKRYPKTVKAAPAGYAVSLMNVFVVLVSVSLIVAIIIICIIYNVFGSKKDSTARSIYGSEESLTNDP